MPLLVFSANNGRYKRVLESLAIILACIISLLSSICHASILSQFLTLYMLHLRLRMFCVKQHKYCLIKLFTYTCFYSIQQTEPEIIEETNVDRVNEPRSYTRSRQAKGHSETSTLSSQPSIDEVRQQMHMLLEEAFSLASAGHGGQSRQEVYSSAPHLPYSEVVTSAPGTMTRPRGGVQWVPTYRPEMYQYSLPRPVSKTSL